MNFVIFSFSLAVIIILSISLGIQFFIHKKSDNKLYLYTFLLTVCYIIESFYLHFIDFFDPSTISTLPDTFIASPLFKISIFSVMFFLYCKCVFSILGEKHSKLTAAAIIYFIVLQLYISNLPETTLTLWIFYSLRQFFMIPLCIYFFIRLALIKDTKRKERIFPFVVLILLTLLLNISIIIEDTFVIFQQMNFSTSGIIFKERNYTENIFWLVVSIYTIFLGRKHIKDMLGKSVSEEPQKIDLTPYHFTPRETEIVMLLLDHFENNEISEKLFITKGTLKSHIHNIYAKAEVNHRNEFIRKLSTNHDI